ncbi:MAG: PPOX class probable F420-dependent enzyme [Acidimicrobiales bacterium]|jgi:PPOX class probable F420-dependent enzyme
MPRMDQQTQDEFLAYPHVGVVASLRQDGRPYTVPVWFHWDGEFVWLTGTDSRVWCRQIVRDPNVSLCVEAMAPIAGHIGIDGSAEVLLRDGFDIWPMSRTLAEKYIGKNDPANDAAVDAFFANMQTEPRLLIRITPEVWRAIDMRVYEGKRADRNFKRSQSN